MSVSSAHPEYSPRIDEWGQMAATYAGEKHVKAAGELYLPFTSGMIADGTGQNQPGRKAYDAYRKRAVYHNFVREAVQAMIGVMHHKPPVIELPASMESLRERATLRGESLEMLLRNINEQQLVRGRLGLLAEPIEGQGVGKPPLIATYLAENIRNWDEGTRTDPELRNLNLVVLDESAYERDSVFEWQLKKRYRVLILGDPLKNEAEGAGASYTVGLYEDNSDFSPATQTEPQLGGGKKAQFIPFVFINSCDIEPSPDEPPLLGLSNLCLSIYRLEADYRQSLFMQGQDTLVTIGYNKAKNDEELRVGAGGRIDLSVGGDAKFIGVESSGLSEQREALKSDKEAAASKGGQLMDSVSRERESGDALKIRVAARTATLNQLALTGAYGLAQLLKMMARWMGANPDEVTVTPNLDFADDELAAKTIVEWMSAKTMGAPISLETIHENLRRRELTSLTFEEEMAKIAGDTNDPLNDPANDPNDQGA